MSTVALLCGSKGHGHGSADGNTFFLFRNVISFSVTLLASVRKFFNIPFSALAEEGVNRRLSNHLVVSKSA